MTTTAIPNEIVAAVNTMLAPYGEEFMPKSGAALHKRYLTMPELEEYTGFKKSFLYKQIAEKRLRVIQGCRSGSVRFDINDVDRWMLERKRR